MNCIVEMKENKKTNENNNFDFQNLKKNGTGLNPRILNSLNIWYLDFIERKIKRIWMVLKFKYFQNLKNHYNFENF